MNEDLTGSRAYQGNPGSGHCIGVIRSVHWTPECEVYVLVEDDRGNLSTYNRAWIRTKP